jgi:hypothetical protein
MIDGTGMVTAAKTVTVTYRSGRSEVLKAGITRLAPNHALVKQRPELFLPSDPEDKATATRMLESGGIRTRVLDQTRTERLAPERSSVPTRRTYRRHQLRPRRPQRSKPR